MVKICNPINLAIQFLMLGRDAHPWSQNIPDLNQLMLSDGK